MLLELQEKVVERLNLIAASQEAFLRISPEGSKDAGRAGVRRALFVGYTGSTFTRPGSTQPVTQDRTANFEIRIELRDLQDPSPVLPLIDAIHAVLTGYFPQIPVDNEEGSTVSGPMYPNRDGFVDSRQGTHFYVLTYSVPLIHKQAFTQDFEPDLPEGWQLNSIISGVHRARIGNLADEVLDRVVVVPLPE